MENDDLFTDSDSELTQNGPSSSSPKQRSTDDRRSSKSHGPHSPGGCKPPGSPETCSICLGGLQNKSFTDSCFHTFCFVCLSEWSKVKAVCPLCKASFKSIIHNVRSNSVYDQYHVSENAETATPAYDRSFRYRSTMTADRYRFLRQHMQQRPGDTIHSLPRYLGLARTSYNWRRRRQVASSEFRRRVYDEGLYVEPNTTTRSCRYRDTSPRFFAQNPAVCHRLVPWLNRELSVLLNNHDDHCQFVCELILDLIKHFEIQSPEFDQHVRTFFGQSTDHFIHELYQFARSPYDMIAYDSSAQYQQASRGQHSDSSGDIEVISVTSPATNGPSTSSAGVHHLERNPEPPAPSHHFSGDSVLTPLLSRVAGFLDSVDTAHTSWDSPMSGAPDYDFSTETTENWGSVVPNSCATDTNTQSRDSSKTQSRDSSSSGEVIFLKYEKPWAEQTPIVLSSDSEAEIVAEKLGNPSSRHCSADRRPRRWSSSPSPSQSGRDRSRSRTGHRSRSSRGHRSRSRRGHRSRSRRGHGSRSRWCKRTGSRHISGKDEVQNSESGSRHSSSSMSRRHRSRSYGTRPRSCDRDNGSGSHDRDNGSRELDNGSRSRERHRRKRARRDGGSSIEYLYENNGHKHKGKKHKKHKKHKQSSGRGSRSEDDVRIIEIKETEPDKSPDKVFKKHSTGHKSSKKKGERATESHNQPEEASTHTLLPDGSPPIEDVHTLQRASTSTAINSEPNCTGAEGVNAGRSTDLRGTPRSPELENAQNGNPCSDEIGIDTVGKVYIVDSSTQCKAPVGISESSGCDIVNSERTNIVDPHICDDDIDTVNCETGDTIGKVDIVGSSTRCEAPVGISEGSGCDTANSVLTNKFCPHIGNDGGEDAGDLVGLSNQINKLPNKLEDSDMASGSHLTTITENYVTPSKREGSNMQSQNDVTIIPFLLNSKGGEDLVELEKKMKEKLVKKMKENLVNCFD